MSITDPLTAIALEMASMDQDENVEDSAEVKNTLQSLNSKIPLTLKKKPK